MKKYTIKIYEKEDYANWNAFIGKAKNATFLFHRDFMDYHKDRFEDYSLVVLEDEKWLAVLPANRVENRIYSHQGLTYGSLVYNDKLKLATVINVLRDILSFLNENNIVLMHLKTIPAIYHTKPAEELNYALFLANAKLERRDTLSVIDLSREILIASGRKEGIRKGKANKLEIIEVNEFDDFWNEILVLNLSNKYDVKPVHTLQEISKLKILFPKNIRQFNVYENGIIIAGTTIFESKKVVHSQYISGKKHKNNLGALDFLYHHLITNVFKDKHFFDFGISNEEQGRKLNTGLVFWKESFGASTMCHDFYAIETQNYTLLDTVFI